MATRRIPVLTEEVKARYHSKVDRRGANECWPWIASGHERGYGIITIRRIDYKATHVALMLDGRPRPPAPGDCALHSCHNPKCVNPSHLRWGTMAENNEDKMRAGRFIPHRGERNGRAVLSDEQVKAIRASNGSSRVVGELYGVSGKQVRAIRRGEAWRHVQ